MPMMFSSYAELDYVRLRLTPMLERRIEAKGFKVLNWADGGWVHTFTKKPARTPDDVRRLKLFTSAGDAETERLYNEFGFHVVPLALTDLVTALQTGMIDAFSTVPLFAQLQESYKLAPHMIDVPWMPLVGGTVISQQAWEQIPAGSRAAMLEAAHASGERLRSGHPWDGRPGGARNGEARPRRRPSRTPPRAPCGKSSAESTYGRLRGSYCPADLLTRCSGSGNEFRR